LDAIDCCSHTPAPGLVVNGDEQTMRPGVTVIVEPRLALGRGERMEIERDRRIDDVMIVDIGQRLEVVERCRSNRIVGHGELYAGLSMRKSSRANHQARARTTEAGSSLTDRVRIQRVVHLAGQHFLPFSGHALTVSAEKAFRRTKRPGERSDIIAWVPDQEPPMSAIESLKRNPSAALLGIQLLGFLLYPLMEASPTGRALFGVFGLLVLGVALRVVRRSPALTWVGRLLALPVVILSIASAIAPRPELVVWTAALEAVFYFYAAGSLIAYMWQDWETTTDELFAAGATFTLLAWAFAYVFLVCQA
jgi:hypothetical protein